MDRLEELIRESLQARAQDVEPTPALWQEVDRRVSRRRWSAVVSWSLAGAAAAVVAAVAVPAVIDDVRGPEPLSIDDFDGAPTDGPSTGPEGSDTTLVEPSDPGTGPTVVGEATLPAPVVTATVTDLVLHGPDGREVLYTLPTEGESSFLSVAVRPGSTVDDLTVVALHLAEGMQDLRTYRVVDGHVEVEYWPEQYQVGAGGTAGDAVAAFGPVWHPAGDKLAWIEQGTGGTPNLRVIGWTDEGPGTGDTATDDASWLLDDPALQGTVVEPVEWVDLGDGRTEIHAVSEDFSDQWIAVPLEIQADGAVAVAAEPEWRDTGANGGTGGRVGGVAGPLVDGYPRWVLQGDAVVLHGEPLSPVIIELPEEFFPGEGLPDTWMRELGDGVLVGMSNTGLAYYVTPDGEVASLGVDDVLDGDVVG